MKAVVLISFFGVFYAYFGYPLLLAVIRQLRGAKEINFSDDLPQSVSVIITCRNEEAVIAEKLENTLVAAEIARKKGIADVQIIVASDYSDDETDEIAKSYQAQGVELVRTAERGGKENAQQSAFSSSRGEVIVFTDAKVALEPEGIYNFLRYFADQNIGAVSSIDRVISDEGAGSGEGFYVRYEMFLRKLESDVSTLIGLSGSGFAVRRLLCEKWNSQVPSDFNLLLRCQEEGLRGVHGADVVCSYRAVKTEEEEFKRKVRTVLRGITTLGSCARVLNPFRFGAFSLQIASHKLCRWLVPWFCILGTVALISLASSGFWALVLLCTAGFYGLAAAAFFKPTLRGNVIFKIPLFFCVTNAAVLNAGLLYIAGTRSVKWDPSKKMSGSTSS